MKCLNEYGECGWKGNLMDCVERDFLFYCPKCGSGIEVEPHVDDLLNVVEERMAV